MAKGIICDSLQNARTLRLAHSAAVEAREIVVNNGSVLVAVNKADQDAENSFVYMAKATFPKEAALAINPLDKLYFDESEGVITKTAAGNIACGFCVEPALAADADVTFYLLPTFNVLAAGEIASAFKSVTVNVAVGETAGASAADPDLVGGVILGIVPAGNQDQLIDNVAVGGDGAVTVTLAAAATAQNNSKVTVLRNA